MYMYVVLKSNTYSIIYKCKAHKLYMKGLSNSVLKSFLNMYRFEGVVTISKQKINKSDQCVNHAELSTRQSDLFSKRKDVTQ